MLSKTSMKCPTTAKTISSKVSRMNNMLLAVDDMLNQMKKDKSLNNMPMSIGSYVDSKTRKLTAN